jgi:hypothetical protein
MSPLRVSRTGSGRGILGEVLSGCISGVLCNRAQMHAYLHVHDVVQMRKATAQTLRWVCPGEPVTRVLSRRFDVMKDRFSRLAC